MISMVPDKSKEVNQTMSNKAVITAVTNQKGGTGKTTTCENLGIGLAMEGKKVLLVDPCERENACSNRELRALVCRTGEIPQSKRRAARKAAQAGILFCKGYRGNASDQRNVCI